MNITIHFIKETCLHGNTYIKERLSDQVLKEDFQPSKQWQYEWHDIDSDQCVTGTQWPRKNKNYKDKGEDSFIHMHLVSSAILSDQQ